MVAVSFFAACTNLSGFLGFQDELPCSVRLTPGSPGILNGPNIWLLCKCYHSIHFSSSGASFDNSSSFPFRMLYFETVVTRHNWWQMSLNIPHNSIGIWVDFLITSFLKCHWQPFMCSLQKSSPYT